MFNLSFDIPPLKPRINIRDHLILLGSCFSNDIGRKLIDHKFNCLINPIGTIYNPISILKQVRDAIGDIQDVSVVAHENVFHDFDAHSKVASLNREELIRQVVAARVALKNGLSRTNWIMVTPGTAWVYELKDTGQIVANCHKVPQDRFQKRLLTPGEIIEYFDQTHDLVKQTHPRAQWLFTISPVRHIRDGLIANNQSKGVLQLAIRDIVDAYEDCHYFPSYEIVVDELRDYRFFKQDLTHPSALATDYIWERLCQVGMDEPTNDFIRVWKKICKSLAHKPFLPEDPAHQRFLHETISRLRKLEGVVDVGEEIDQLSKQLQ